MGAAQAQLEDKYYLQKVKLGEGSFGVVWRGVEKATGTPVAVKQMEKAQLPRRGIRREDVEREVSCMKVVHHENILRLFDFCEDYQLISFVLEYCDGGDFGDKVKERGSSVTEEEACKWMKQILLAIQALHSKEVCHRDIKPDNFMVSKSQIIKLADFGLATILTKGKLLTEKCGTPAFMAPEQLEMIAGKSRGYNHSVDVWAAGISMFMLMTGGTHPFVGSLGRLDEQKLIEGDLDFGPQGVFAIFFQSGGFSEAAKAFCRKMVRPCQQTRVTAEAALKDPWMALAAVTVDRGDATRRPSERVRQHPGGQPAVDNVDASTIGQPVATMAQMMNLGGWLFGDDQNKPPNAQMENEQVRKRLQENTVLKRGIEELELETKELQKQLTEKADKKRAAAGYPGVAQAADDPVTLREGDRRRMSNSIPGSNFSGRLPPNLKVRYNSSSARCWLTATVESFNDNDGTYNLDMRQHADLSNISPDPSVRQAEAWPPGSMVSYHSSSAGRWLDACVVGFNEGTGGIVGTYNLDLRQIAEVDRIRPRLVHGVKISLDYATNWL